MPRKALPWDSARIIHVDSIKALFLFRMLHANHTFACTCDSTHARCARGCGTYEIVGECLHDCLRTRKRSYAIRFYAENEDIKCIIVSAKYKVYYSRSFANSPAIISRARTKIRVEMREDSLRCTSNRVKRDYSAFCFLPLPYALFHLCYLS